jgi:hypothetical protein
LEYRNPAEMTLRSGRDCLSEWKDNLQRSFRKSDHSISICPAWVYTGSEMSGLTHSHRPSLQLPENPYRSMHKVIPRINGLMCSRKQAVNRKILSRVHFNMGCIGLRSWSSRLTPILQYFNPYYATIFVLITKSTKGH